MIIYREAKPEEFEEIAKLHAKSWAIFYRNIFSDDYLDNEVFPDRLVIWSARAKVVDSKRIVIVAEDKRQLIGFVCTFLDHSSEHGALLDNLHVLPEHQGKGIGLALIEKSFDWVKENRPLQKMYLTVLTENLKSKGFYYRFGGSYREEFLEKTPYGDLVPVERISWNQRPKLV
ncbi:MAG: GNAT superfamily N-acetyltransferase [Arcticibacterium sp.]|jgi:GNAT superfamily N-acetyltransferase